MKLDSSLSAVVTGGASGLGLATVRALRDAGVKVAIFDINEDSGQAIAAEVGATFCQVDIMSEDSVLAGFDAARAAQGQVHTRCSTASRVMKPRVNPRPPELTHVASYRANS